MTTIDKTLFNDIYHRLLPEASYFTDDITKRHAPSPELFELIIWNLVLGPIAAVFFTELYNRLKNKSKRGLVEEEQVEELLVEVEKIELRELETNSDRILTETERLLASFGLTQDKSTTLAREITRIRIKHVKRGKS